MGVFDAMPPDSLVSLEQEIAIQRYQLQRVLPFFETPGEYFDQALRIHVVEGDLRVDGDLHLDWNETLENGQWVAEAPWQGHCGLVVTGDLAIAGNLINASANGGPFLVTFGDLSARNLLAGGAWIHVEGDANIAELALAHYNDGSLHINGHTRAALIINDDHDVHIHTDSLFWNGHGEPAGMPLSEYLHADVAVEVDEDFDLPLENPDTEQLIARIIDGEPVLRAADDKRPRKSKRKWLADFKKDACLLRHVPAALIDENMARVGVSGCGRTLQYVPEALRSAELCAAAMADDADAFPFVPEALRTREWSEQAVSERGSHLKHVPARFLDSQLILRAVESSGSMVLALPPEMQREEYDVRAVSAERFLYLKLPVERRTFEVSVAAVRRDPELIDQVPDELRQRVSDRVAEVGPFATVLSAIPADEADFQRFDDEIREIYWFNRQDFQDELEWFLDGFSDEVMDGIREARDEQDASALGWAIRALNIQVPKLIPGDLRQLGEEIEAKSRDGDWQAVADLIGEFEQMQQRLVDGLQAAAQRW